MFKKLLVDVMLLQGAYAAADIDSTKVAMIYGPIIKNSVTMFKKDIEKVKNIPGDYVIIINSGGGSQVAGQDIIDIIESLKKTGIKFTCVVDHEASSMAFNIFTHCNLRYATSKSHFLVHKVEFNGIDQLGERNTAKFLREIADDLDKTDEPYRQANSKAMGMDVKTYDYFADNETIWTEKGLLKLKYLDGVGDLGLSR